MKWKCSVVAVCWVMNWGVGEARAGNTDEGGLDCEVRKQSESVANCEPNCLNKECGDDGCGGSCGTCGKGSDCEGSQCVNNSCYSDCSGKECGDSGCGGSCGTCPQGSSCTLDGVCEKACLSSLCPMASCGALGCDGACGTCSQGHYCDGTGQCRRLLVPSRAGWECTDEACVPSSLSYDFAADCEAHGKCEVK